ncbi:MAG TPA: Rieske 2Fe-2S domain-containing protein [Micromonosporaceae bacterium]
MGLARITALMDRSRGRPGPPPDAEDATVAAPATPAAGHGRAPTPAAERRDGCDAVTSRTLLGKVWVRTASSAAVGRRLLPWQVPGDDEDRTVLLWRTRRGRLVALDARCPHRRYLMADARLVRDTVECPRHGYRFNADGRCVNIPHGPPARLVDAREIDGYIWVAL